MGKFLEQASTNTSTPKTVDYFYYQQDTIPKTQPKDTTETIPEGINPLFLLIERKTREVEALKEQAEQPKPPVVRRPVVPEVDTICYICRDGLHRPLHEIVQLEGQLASQSIVEEFLHDASYYNEVINLNQKVFIETVPPKPTQRIHIKPLEHDNARTPWLFYPMLTMLILLVFLKIFFTKQINELFRGALFYHIGKKILRENTIVLNRFFRVLDTGLLVSLPIAAIQTINLFGLSKDINESIVIFALYISLGFIGYRAFRFLSHRIIGFVSNTEQAIASLHINQLIYERAFGLMLIPLNLLMLYSSSGARFMFLYITLGAIAISLTFRLIRTIQVFLFNGFSMFYLFLYLCALEIIPILIIINEFFRG